jgi:hypothetical protein
MEIRKKEQLLKQERKKSVLTVERGREGVGGVLGELHGGQGVRRAVLWWRG